MPITPEELDCRFTHHKPAEGQSEKYGAIRAKARELAELIIEATPESREQSTAVTKVEEACMWANAAVARRGQPHGHQGFNPLAGTGS